MLRVGSYCYCQNTGEEQEGSEYCELHREGNDTADRYLICDSRKSSLIMRRIGGGVLVYFIALSPLVPDPMHYRDKLKIY